MEPLSFKINDPGASNNAGASDISSLSSSSLGGGVEGARGGGGETSGAPSVSFQWMISVRKALIPSKIRI